jgi:hypothetical protein
MTTEEEPSGKRVAIYANNYAESFNVHASSYSDTVMSSSEAVFTMRGVYLTTDLKMLYRVYRDEADHEKHDVNHCGTVLVRQAGWSIETSDGLVRGPVFFTDWTGGELKTKWVAKLHIFAELARKENERLRREGIIE